MWVRRLSPSAYSHLRQSSWPAGRGSASYDPIYPVNAPRLAGPNPESFATVALLGLTIIPKIPPPLNRLNQSPLAVCTAAAVGLPIAGILPMNDPTSAGESQM